MSRVSPTLEGFRATFRRPSLTFAEISWRWTVGAIGWALIFFGCIEFLDTLRVSKGDAALLATRQPLLVGRAIEHILRGSLMRASMAALFAALALAVLWIGLASIGRAVTVRALLQYFRDKFAEQPEVGAGEIVRENASNNPPATKAKPPSSLIGLNFLRVAVALAGLLALVGAAVVVSFASTEKNPHPALVFPLYLPLAGLICLAWSALNWLLSLAAVFAIRSGEDSLGAIREAVTFFRAHLGAVAAVSTWTGLAHLTAFSVATTVVSMPLAFAQIVPGRLVLAIVMVMTLAYFAVADWLYMARLAGYVCIAEMSEAVAMPAPLPSSPSAPLSTAIDRSELILSDIPGLA